MGNAESSNPTLEVLYNDDILSQILSHLEYSAPATLPKSSSGKACHPLLSLALTNTTISKAARGQLWRKLPSFRCILNLFPLETTSSGIGTVQVIPRVVAQNVWDRLDWYASQVQQLTMDKNSRRAYSPAVYVRLAQKSMAIFPNLLRLVVDVDFATDYAVFLFYSSPRLSAVEITLDASPNTTMVAAAVLTASWSVRSIQTFKLSCPAFQHLDRKSVPSMPLQGVFESPIISQFATISHLDFGQYTISYGFFATFSNLHSLQSLQIIITADIPREESPCTAGFSSLRMLGIWTSVTMMPRILRLLPHNTLEDFRFTDTSKKSYDDRYEFMNEFHTRLATFPSLIALRIAYDVGIMHELQAVSSRAMFEPFSNLHQLKIFGFEGQVSLDVPTLSRLVKSWKGLQRLEIVSKSLIQYQILPCIARACSQLEELSLPLLFPDADPEVPETGVGKHRLSRLHSTEGVIRGPAVARYLDNIFPHLMYIEGGMGWEDVKKILVLVCQPVRRDQMKRDKERC